MLAFSLAGVSQGQVDTKWSFQDEGWEVLRWEGVLHGPGQGCQSSWVLERLTLILLYIQVFLRTQNFSGQRAMFPTSTVPGRFLCEEQMSGPCCLGMKNLSPCYRQTEGTTTLCALQEGGMCWAPSRTVLRSAETL